MFVQDERFWGSLKNTLYYTVVSVPLNIGIALLLAILLNKRLPGTNIFRGIIYAPSVLAGVAVYIGWTYLYGNDTGMINYLLYKIFHIIGPNWLQDANWAMTALIIMNVFTCGSVMLIILAGLQDVPAIYYEAAKLDGASPFKMYEDNDSYVVTGFILCIDHAGDCCTSNFYSAVYYDPGRTNVFYVYIRVAFIQSSISLL